MLQVNVMRIFITSLHSPLLSSQVPPSSTIDVEVERVSLQRNDFAANSYFTLKAERARIVRRSSESAASSPGGPSLGLANFEILVSKLLALLAVFSFVVEELVVEIELLSIGDSKKLLSVTR